MKPEDELPQTAKTLLDERLATENKADAIPFKDAQKMWRKKYGLILKHKDTGGTKKI